MIKRFINYVWQGWQSDNATWLNVFVSLMACAAVCYLSFFLLFGWMIIVY